MATQTWDRPATSNRSRLRLSHVIVVLVAIPVLFHIGIDLWRSPITDFYMTVDELAARPAAGQTVRVGGDVVPGSLQWDPLARVTSFEIQGQNSRLQVLYHGLAPEAMTHEATAIVDGARSSDGTFRATNLMVKCPHRYQAI